MNCNIAFELMTEPHGGRSLALREHLERCPRCRQMRETLAPALEWLADDAHVQGLEFQAESPARSPMIPPAMPMVVTADSVAIARQSAERLSVRCAPSTGRVGRGIAVIVRSAALVAFGGFLALTLLPGGNSGDRPAERRTPGGDSACRRHDVAAGRAPSQSPAEIRALIASCAACHDNFQKTDRADRRRNAIDPRGDRLLAMAIWDIALL
jgi:cytochrome c553